MTYREEVSVMHDPEEDDSHQSLVPSKNNAGCKYLLQLPAIGDWRWLNTILWDGHDCSLKCITYEDISLRLISMLENTMDLTIDE